MSDLNDLAQQVVSWAKDDEQVEAYVSRGVDTEIVVYEGDIESFSRAEGLGVGIRVIKDSRQGFSYAGTFDIDMLREAYVEARDNASFATPDEFVGLVEPDGVEPAQLDLWNDEALKLATDKKIEMAIELDCITRAGDPRVRNVESSEYGDGVIEATIASTAGINASYKRAGCYVSASVIAGDGDDTHTGGGYSVGRAPSELDINKAAEDAVSRAIRLLGAMKPKSDTITVLFDNRITPVLLGALASALNAESVIKGRSFLANQEGNTIATTNLTLVDDPTNINAYGATPFDGEGLASRRNVLVENGILRDFLHSGYTARRTGRKSNGAAVRGGFKSGPGPGARALALTPGALSQDEIINTIDNGLLVQSVLGASTGGINPVSGGVSLGAEGILILDGELTEPVRELTIASTIQNILQNILHIGSDVDWLPGAAAGVSLAVGDMQMSGL
jgi:PmbA protein